MPANGSTPRFARNPRNFDAIITAALTNLNTDAPSGAVLLVTAGAQGSTIPRLGAILRATLATNAGLVLFRSPDQGATLRPKASVTIAAQTVAPTEALREVDFVQFSESRQLRLGPNERLYVGSMVAPPTGGICVHGDIVDFIPDPA